MGRTVQTKRRRRRCIFPGIHKDVESLILRKLNRLDMFMLYKACFPNSTQISEDLPAYAAKLGYLKLLKWLRKQGCVLDMSVTENAVQSGNLKLLDWLRSEKCPFESCLCSTTAARYGHIMTLEWLRTNGYIVHINCAVKSAIVGNCLPALEWCVGNGQKLNLWIFYDAVEYSNINIVKWLLKKKCPLTKFPYAIAAEYKRMDVLTLLQKRKIDWNEQTCCILWSKECKEALHWAVNTGMCQCNEADFLKYHS